MVKDKSISIELIPEHEQVSLKNKSTLSVLAKIKAGKLPESEENRSPVDICLCLDVSGSMSGSSKLELVKKTSKLLVNELRSDDTLCIVSFESNVRTELAKIKMNENGRELAKHAISKLRPMGATNLSGGVLQAISELRGASEEKRQRSSSLSSRIWQRISSSKINEEEESDELDNSVVRVASVLLLTDGQANNGVTDHFKLGELVRKSLGPDITLNTFGYGSDAAVDMLTQLAEVGNGSSYFVENPDDVSNAFADCLGGLLSIVAQNISITITAAKNVELSGFSRGGDQSSENVEFDSSHISLTLKDLFAEETRNVVFEVCFKKSQIDPAQPVARIDCSFVDVVFEESTSCSAELSVSRVTKVESSANPDVARQVHRVRAAETMREAMQLADASKFAECRARLEAERKELESDTRFKTDKLVQELLSDVTKQMEDTRTYDAYAGGGRHKMMSKQRHYKQERSMASAPMEMENVYMTSSKSRMVSAFK